MFKDGFYDVKKMVVEVKRILVGLIYVCNLNNLMGSVMVCENIDWFMVNKLSSIKVFIDEVYIYFIDDKFCIDFVGCDDVFVLCIFLKIYGMVGLCVGYFFVKEEFKKKVEGFKSGVLLVMVMVVVVEMLCDLELILMCCVFFDEICGDFCVFFDSEGFEYVLSCSFKVMVDMCMLVEKVIKGMWECKVYVGCLWFEWLMYLCVLLGLVVDMKVFKKNFLVVMVGI